jgi:Protein of unknown function (DUF4242)
MRFLLLVVLHTPYVTGDKVYCVYLAPEEATIQEHAKRVGVPANRVSAVRRLIDPATADERWLNSPRHPDPRLHQLPPDRASVR